LRNRDEGKRVKRSTEEEKQWKRKEERSNIERSRDKGKQR
jgi:hypothetical protein